MSRRTTPLLFVPLVAGLLLPGAAVSAPLHGTNVVAVPAGSLSAAKPAGDVNGDGIGDLVLTVAPGAAGKGATAAVIFGGRPLSNVAITRSATGDVDSLGSRGLLIRADPSLTPRAGDVVEATAVGDVDRDGFDDLAVGVANQAGLLPHSVFIVYGAASTDPLRLAQGPRVAAIAVSSAGSDATRDARVTKIGDFDGDGFADFATTRSTGTVAAGTIATGAAIIRGGPRIGALNVSSAASARVVQLAGYRSCAFSWTKFRTVCSAPPMTVSGIGDFNGDGRGDLFVDNGRADGRALVLGRAAGGTITGGTSAVVTSASVGFDPLSVVPVGDVNGDAKADFAFLTGSVAAPSSTAGVLLGRGVPAATIQTSEAALLRTAAGSVLGVAGAGDQNADGRTKVAVVVGSLGTADPFRREVKVVAPSAAGPVNLDAATAVSGLPTENTDRTASALIASAGDVDGDRGPDLIYGDTDASSLSIATSGADRAAPQFMSTASGNARLGFRLGATEIAPGDSVDRTIWLRESAAVATRYLRPDGSVAASETRSYVAGKTTERWDGTVDGRALNAGTYVAEATPRDDAGNTGLPIRQTLTIKAPPAPALPYLDRLNFGDTGSEAAHGFNPGASSLPPSGTGAFGQTYRQPLLSTYQSTTHTSTEQLTFTLKVDPVKQNYLTVKLWGSDTQWGVLRMVDGEAIAKQLDNNLSNSSGNPPFYGRFHYATTSLPLASTQGKTSVTVGLFSEGYYYDDGRSRVGQKTRPIYSAFSHLTPAFVPPAGEQTGTAPVQVGAQAPATVDRAAVYRNLKRSRANIYGLDGVPDGFWNPGGTLARADSVIPAGTPGAPPEVIGMHLGDGPVTQAQIAEINGQPNAADVWRDRVGGRQLEAIRDVAGIYTTPPLKDENGAVVPGYDRYLDPAMLERLVGLLDGQARSQGGSGSALGGWDTGCIGQRWSGLTSTPRTSGPWAGSSARQSGGCISFEDLAPMGRAFLRLLVDDPAAATAFRTYLNQPIDADLKGTMVKRAYVYERMLASSSGWLGFNPDAVTSTDYFVKFGGTVVQGQIFVRGAYTAQLALRELQKVFPNSAADTQPMNPALLRRIVRQLSGLDDLTLMRPGPVPGWRAITAGGISETYGTLSSGYDGRYGGAIAPAVGEFARLAKYDGAMSVADQDELGAMARRTISAFDNFLYPQHQIQNNPDGSVTDTYALGQEDVISHRVPYGPNANGWNLNPQPLAVDPAGVIHSPEARRSFLLQATRDPNTLIGDLGNYPEMEAAWKSVAGVDPATIPKLPGEPGAGDFVWADNGSGALAMAYQGERLFLNANYNRDKGAVNNYARVHLVADTIDREATVRMPFDASTVQDDGNLSGGFDGAWVVRFGKYLVVMNRSSAAYRVTFPAGRSAVAVRAKTTVAAGASATVDAGGYEVFVLS